MGTGGFVWGGLAQGIGQGIAKQGEMAAEERRQMALESLRQSNDMERINTQADLQDRNDARSTQRGLSADISRAGAQGEIQATRDEKQFGYDLKILNVKDDQEKANMRLKSALDLGNDQAVLELRQKLDNGTVRQLTEGGDGNYYASYGDGRMVNTGVPVPVKTSNDSGSVLDQARAARGGTPAPAASAPASTQPSRSVSAQKTYTLQDAQATAKKHGVTVEEVNRRMRAQGYKLTGG